MFIDVFLLFLIDISISGVLQWRPIGVVKSQIYSINGTRVCKKINSTEED